MTMSKDVAKKLCKTGIAHWKEIFFVENADYYKKLLEKMTKKMGFIQLDNPVEIKSWVDEDHWETIDHVDYLEGFAVCVFRNNRDQVEFLNCYDNMSIVKVGRELVRTLQKNKVAVKE